jgi:hypothetical protein
MNVAGKRFENQLDLMGKTPGRGGKVHESEAKSVAAEERGRERINYACDRQDTAAGTS